jgi:hypothetical protein
MGRLVDPHHQGMDLGSVPDAIRRVAQGLGDDNPLWWRENHGRDTRWGEMIAPPTFLYSCSSGGRWPGDDGVSPAHDFVPGTAGVWA